MTYVHRFWAQYATRTHTAIADCRRVCQAQNGEVTVLWYGMQRPRRLSSRRLTTTPGLPVRFILNYLDYTAIYISKMMRSE